ncbi:MAG: hypothetical protein FJ087_14700 [Deltaproteobacteria bacterium]|nr:hypothetical protein [Deltaproteobacteria bacterium]
MAGFDDPNAIELGPALGSGLDLEGLPPARGGRPAAPRPGGGLPADLGSVDPRGPGAGTGHGGPAGPAPGPGALHGTPGSPGAPPRPANLPPLFAALYKAVKEGRSGVVTAGIGEERTGITVSGGRITAVAHPDTSATAIVALLTRIGLVNDHAVEKCERAARKRNMLLEDAIAAAGYVSPGTLQNVREMLCREVLLDLVLRRDLEVSAVWTIRKGAREMCVLPVPFLLKEAQRRAREAPEVRRVVPSYQHVYGRTAALQGREPERWEELRLSAAERQVYFFVDGRRTVTELAAATCQPEFDLARSLKSLIEGGLVQRVGGVPGATASALASRSAIKRVAAQVVAVATLLAAIAVGGTRLQSRAAPPPGPDTFGASMSAAPEHRIAGALRLYHLTRGRAAPSFQELADEHMVLPGDARAALSFPAGDGFLLRDGAAPPAVRAGPKVPAPATAPAPAATPSPGGASEANGETRN